VEQPVRLCNITSTLHLDSIQYFFYLYDLCWFIFSTRATKHAIISKNTFSEGLHIHHKPQLIGLTFHQHFYQSSNKTWCLSAAPDSCHSFCQPYTTNTYYFLCCSGTNDSLGLWLMQTQIWTCPNVLEYTSLPDPTTQRHAATIPGIKFSHYVSSACFDPSNFLIIDLQGSKHK
jgi:hypothetical protein